MGLKRLYTLKCDGCGKVQSDALSTTPRRARSAGRNCGWQRRTVVVGRHESPVYKQDARGNWYQTGEMEWFDDTAGRDFCPACLEKMEVTGD